MINALSLLYPHITQIHLKNLRNLWMSLTVWLFAVATVAGQTPAPVTTSGTITGRVVNESGQPLADASITVYSVGSMQQHNGATTDRDGKFQLSGLEPRSYRIVAWLSSYAPSESSINRIGDSITLTLAKGGVITGTVTSQTGEPVVGVSVHTRMVHDDKNQLSFPLNVFSVRRTTDDRGVYRIYGLRAGTYVVWAGGGGESSPDIDAFDEFVPTYAPASTRDTAEEISVHAGEEVSNVNIRFRGEPGHVISGRASQSASGQPLGFVLNLTAVGKNKPEWTMLTGQPDESRGFIFRGVDDGDYDLSALSLTREGLGGMIATKRIKVSGADVTGIELILEPLASVSGRIVLEEANKSECGGKPRPAFAEILVSTSQNENQASDYHPYVTFMLKGPAAVDANGNVALKNLMPGRYFFVPEFAAKYWYLHSITLPPPVTPGAKTTTQPVDATRTWTTLKSGDRLSGLTITLAQGAASFSGQLPDNPAADLFLYLVPAEKERAEDALRFFGEAIGPNGKVTLNNLPPGSYWILVKSTGEGASTAKLRLPDQKELRASLRREAEAAKTTIELKPCQNLTGFPLKSNQ
jgi:carboxypeptidase family protein